MNFSECRSLQKIRRSFIRREHKEWWKATQGWEVVWYEGGKRYWRQRWCCLPHEVQRLCRLKGWKKMTRLVSEALCLHGWWRTFIWNILFLWKCRTLQLLSACMSVCLSGLLSVCLSGCLSLLLAGCQSLLLPACLSVWLSLLLSISLSVCLSVGLSLLLLICSAFIYFCLSVWLVPRLSVCYFIFVSLPASLYFWHSACLS